MKLDYLHPAVDELFTCGIGAGFVTFDQLIATLPDRYVSPDMANELLVRMHGQEINLVSAMAMPLSQRPYDKEKFGLRVEYLAKTKAAEQDEGDEEVELDGDGNPILSAADAQAQLAAALSEPSNKRIDDPVRMYLTQMGEIPLLTRDEEIMPGQEDRDSPRAAVPPQGARVTTTRRRSLWRCSRWSRPATLPFDRTMKISVTAEEDAKEKIARRACRNNLKTIRHAARASTARTGTASRLEEAGRRTMALRREAK